MSQRPPGSGPPPGFPGGMEVPILGHLPRRQKLMITGAAMLALFVAAINQTLVSTALPRIVADLEGFDELSWVFTSYMVTSTTTAPIWGKLSDVWGRKLFLILGVIIFVATSAAAGASQGIWELIAFRGLQGLGGGMLMACGFTIIGDLYTPAERGRYAGLFSGVFGVASVIGPVAGGALTDHLSWRWVFYANVPVGLAALPILFAVLPAVRQPARGRIDLLGALAMTLAAVPLLMAFVWAGTEYAWDSIQIVGLFLFSGAMTLAFLAVEARAKDPIIPLELFRNRTYTVTAAITFLSGFGMFGAITYVPLFVQGVIGVSATSSGTVTSPMMVAMVITSIIGGNVVSRTGSYKAICVLGMALITVGLYLLSTMGEGATRTEAILFMITVGLGIGAVMPILTVIAQNAIPFRYLGVVTSNLQFYRSIGGTISVAVMGTILTSRLQASLPAPHPSLSALPEQVVRRMRDPQALVSPEIRGSLEAAVGQLPGGEAIFASALESLRLGLASSVQWAFLLGTAISLAGVLVTLFLEEIPLRGAVVRPAPRPTPLQPGGRTADGPPPGPLPAEDGQPSEEDRYPGQRVPVPVGAGGEGFRAPGGAQADGYPGEGGESGSR